MPWQNWVCFSSDPQCQTWLPLDHQRSIRWQDSCSKIRQGLFWGFNQQGLNVFLAAWYQTWFGCTSLQCMSPCLSKRIYIILHNICLEFFGNKVGYSLHPPGFPNVQLLTLAKTPGSFCRTLNRPWRRSARRSTAFYAFTTGFLSPGQTWNCHLGMIPPNPNHIPLQFSL